MRSVWEHVLLATLLLTMLLVAKTEDHVLIVFEGLLWTEVQLPARAQTSHCRATISPGQYLSRSKLCMECRNRHDVGR